MPKYAAPLVIPSDTTKLAYLAGLIDGEGCIHIGRKYEGGRSGAHALQVQVSNSDVRMMVWLSKEFGGRVSPVKRTGPQSGYPRKRQMYVWVICAMNAAQILTAVYPYLVVKQDQADVALALRALFRPRGRVGRQMDPVIQGQREALRLKLVDLKKAAS